MRTIQLWLAAAVLLGAGCRDGGAGGKPGPATNAIGAGAVTNYEAAGVVVRLEPDGRTLIIRHDDITNYMRSMTMPFVVRDTNLLGNIQPGNRVAFRLSVTSGDAWIDSLRVVESNAPPPAHPVMRVVRDVEPLAVGDVLPDYAFTNELNQAVHLANFHGRVFAFTFFFTSCPYPLFCPKMCANFKEAQDLLSRDPSAPKNWHLLAISFDPETDTPSVLKSYARRYDYDPARWSFLTGALIDITALAEQFKLDFWRESGTISHNLRTVVIDPGGRVFKIFQSNEWTPAMLVDAMKQAASAPPRKP